VDTGSDLTPWLKASDAEVAEWLRSAPRRLSQADVDALVGARDSELGEYVPHGGVVHHVAGESRL
jgi:hypothetical protein